MDTTRTTRLPTTRVELVEPGDIMTTVPYGTDGVPRRCWIDLRENPDQIDLIDTLRGRPAMREQVELLNAPETPFMTIACECATTRLFQQGGPPAWMTSSSVQLAFVDPERCDMGRYGSLVRTLHEGLGSEPHATRWNRLVSLRPDPVVFQPGGHAGWSLTISTRAYGLDGETAVHHWSACMQLQTMVIASWTQSEHAPRSHPVDSVSTRVQSQVPPRRIGP